MVFSPEILVRSTTVVVCHIIIWIEFCDVRSNFFFFVFHYKLNICDRIFLLILKASAFGEAFIHRQNYCAPQIIVTSRSRAIHVLEYACGSTLKRQTGDELDHATRMRSSPEYYPTIPDIIKYPNLNKTFWLFFRV